MERIYPSDERTTTGYVRTVESRNDYLTLHVFKPADSYRDKSGNERQVPEVVVKFDVPPAFKEAVAALLPLDAVKVRGRGNAKIWVAPDGQERVITTWRITDLRKEPGLPVLQPPFDSSSLVPF